MRRIGSTPSGSDVSGVPASDPQVFDMRLTAVRPPFEVVGWHVLKTYRVRPRAFYHLRLIIPLFLMSQHI